MSKSAPAPESPSPRRPPLLLLLVAVVVVAAVVAIVLAVSGGDGSSGSDGSVVSSEATGDTTGAAGGAGTIEYGTPTVEGAALSEFGGAEPDPAVGTVAPTVEGQTPTGAAASIAAGAPRLVVFLAHWCPHCNVEADRLRAELQGGLRGDALQIVLTASTSERPNWPPAAWAREKGLGDLPTIVDDAAGTIARAWGLTSFPYIVGVDAGQRVVFRVAGEQAEGFFAEALSRISAGSPASAAEPPAADAADGTATSTAALAPAFLPVALTAARRPTTTRARPTTTRARPTTTRARPATTRARPATSRPAGIPARSTTTPARAATSAPAGVRATVEVVRTIPRDPTVFTQGYEVHGDTVFESGGLYGRSEIRTVSLSSGRVLRRVALPGDVFAEGLTVVPGNRVIQLTWRERTAYVRDATTLEVLGTLRYDEEGWGACWSGAAGLVVHSDGTGVLRLRDAASFAVVGTVSVRLPDGTSPSDLNELECVGDTVYANVWQTPRILQIDLATGRVLRIIDASSIVARNGASPDDVLNGIAQLPNGNLLLTGKRWATAYEVRVVDLPAA